jgi:hypothetical protein
MPAIKELPPVSSQLDTTVPPAMVFAALEAPVQRLVVATHLLYGGHWDDCAEDHRRRMHGQPYLYRLRFDLPDLAGWLERLKAYELARGEDFAAVARRERDLLDADTTADDPKEHH